MTNLREMLLDRLQSYMKTLTPGVTYTMPSGETHRAIETTIGGRVYNRMRSGDKIDRSNCPCAEIVTAPGKPDVVEPHDDVFYRRTIFVQVWGYVYGADAAESGDSDVRPKLNELMADLQVAVEAFPYWTDSTYTDPLVASHGPLIILPVSQWTEPATDQPAGYLVLEYAITYSFNRLKP